MARFEIKNRETGEIYFSGRVTDHGSFYDQLMIIKGEGAEGHGSYWVSGKEVSIGEAVNAAIAQGEIVYAKKCKTHKRVRISQGATALSNTYREVWVRK